MAIASLKPFAQEARRQLLDQVRARLEQVLRIDSVELRKKKQTLEELQEQIDQTSKQAVVDRVAYTWFNRFCALRFMDVNHYTRVGIVSPAEGRTQPEILQDAKQGLVGDWLKIDRQRVLDLLSGKAASSNPQREAYRLLLVGACNAYHHQMPFLFQPIEDYTELLMPDDLLSENSVLQAVQEALTPEACQDVEVIGWLYQYYISERKDEVFANLKMNKKIQPEDIPAATQLFTPHWIVRYLVENSLGRLWMLNHPESKLVEQMEYYIQPEPEETDFLKVGSPEEIKVCDPACGSGHMLTYAFDLLHAIYEEQGYDPVEIPRRILENNLYGMEIDERAGDLAAFALMMKAREQDPRFFSRGVEPKICALENVAFTEDELDAYMNAVGRDLFTQALQETLTQFEQADNFGSLIQPKVNDVAFIRKRVEEQGVFEDLFLHQTNQKVMTVLKQSEFLSSRYHVVVANPPYMNAKGMTEFSKKFAEDNYHSVKSNLFSMFVLRILELGIHRGEIGLMTPISWMSLRSFEALRSRLLEFTTITNFVQPEYNAFWESAHVAICVFTLHSNYLEGHRGSYINLAGFYGADLQPRKTLEAIRNPSCGFHYRASGDDFRKIPGSPIAYWIKGISNFAERLIGDIFVSGGRNKTHNNKKYLRYAWEINRTGDRWVPYANGGNFRKYSGNDLEFIDWSDEARNSYASLGGLSNEKFWGKEGITWSLITSAITGFRIEFEEEQYSSGSPTIFNDECSCDYVLLGFLNSPVSHYYLKAISPTVNTTVNEVFSLPYLERNYPEKLSENVQQCISVSRIDWDAYEIAWDFSKLSLLHPDYRQPLLKATYQKKRDHWRELTLEMQRLETENNRFFIETYGLQEELTPEVPLEEITLTCNPHYRYGTKKSEAELEALLMTDTMKEFISYAVGCMLGRYSLDKPGLILANQGETAEHYRTQVPDPTYPPDEDNVIPILDEGWFADDIVERFKQFLRVTFGTENYEENLAFLEAAIGKDIRSYFLKSFYSEHVKMYKKRPIYWLFSSPNGSFNALIYMHRYRPDTISIILNDYLRQFHEKLRSHREQLEQVSVSSSASRSEKTKALKEIDKVSKVLTELKVYEDEILYPLASKQVEIDLDDGVKVNYKKLGKALKHVIGLSQ